MDSVRTLCQQPDSSPAALARRERQNRAQVRIDQAQDILSLTPRELRQRWVYSEVGLRQRNRVRRLGLGAGILSGAALGALGGWAGSLAGGLIGGALGLLIPRALEWNQREQGLAQAVNFSREQVRAARQELASLESQAPAAFQAPEATLGRLQAGLVVGGVLIRQRNG